MFVPSPDSLRQGATSRLKGFYKLNRDEKLARIRAFADLKEEEIQILQKDGALDFRLSNSFVENAIGCFPLPLGLGTNFQVNGDDVLVPMCVEESSVIAAASNAARIVYESGGFSAETLSQAMIGQVQLVDLDISQLTGVKKQIEIHRARLIALANSFHPNLLARGGGVRDIEVRLLTDLRQPMAVIHVICDTCDAMGANIINTICEGLAPELARIAGARAGLKILSNLADRRVYRASCQINSQLLASEVDGQILAGSEVARLIEEACYFAEVDSYRAATHNKGIMNGVDPVVIATGNDWRAIEAGAHAYAARSGRYKSLSKWTAQADGSLRGELEIPMQLGTVGGMTKIHPIAALSLKILGMPNSNELSQIAACVGLASNFAALKALATTGIQKGHMRLHAANLTLAAQK